MRREDFLQMMDEAYNEIVDLNTKKGSDYAGNEDALSNFKEQAKALGLTPEQIWSVYATKHWSAITTYCKEGQVESEPIEGRILDVILYGFLLLGLVTEKYNLNK